MKKSLDITAAIGVQKLNVFIRFNKDEIFVGQLKIDQQIIYFKYDESFLEFGLNLSPFRLKFDNRIQAADPDPFHGLFGLLKKANGNFLQPMI